MTLASVSSCRWARRGRKAALRTRFQPLFHDGRGYCASHDAGMRNRMSCTSAIRFEIRDFVGETARYIEMFRPKLTIINSTVASGDDASGRRSDRHAVVNSPVRGKHVRMLEELRQYTKFSGRDRSRSRRRKPPGISSRRHEDEGPDVSRGNANWPSSPKQLTSGS